MVYGVPAVITGTRAVVPYLSRGLPTLFNKVSSLFGRGAGAGSKGAGGIKSLLNKAKGTIGRSGKFVGKALFNPYLTTAAMLGPSVFNPESGLRQDIRDGNYLRAGMTGLGTLGGYGLAKGLAKRSGLGGISSGILGLAGAGVGNRAGFNFSPKSEMPSLPEIGGQAIAQGITGLGELAGSGENIKNTLQDLGGLYAQGKIMDALGFPQADQYADMELRNYLGSKLLGQSLETIPNIALGSGLGSLGQYSQTDNNYSQIINNPYKEQIKNSQGLSSITDEDIMIFLADYNNGPTGKKSDKVFDKNGNLKPESVRMLMLVQALQQPTNLPVNNARNDVQARNMQARMDIQNQLGGKFKTIDPNQLYPTYTQPNVAINAPRTGYADGGVASFPDLSGDGKITKKDILMGRGVDLRDGGEASGPGTGTSDSIPARLSDGEFVMTAEAVRNAGDGDRAEGVRKMYELMNSLEAR